MLTRGATPGGITATASGENPNVSIVSQCKSFTELNAAFHEWKETSAADVSVLAAVLLRAGQLAKGRRERSVPPEDALMVSTLLDDVHALMRQHDVEHFLKGKQAAMMVYGLAQTKLRHDELLATLCGHVIKHAKAMVEVVSMYTALEKIYWLWVVWLTGCVFAGVCHCS